MVISMAARMHVAVHHRPPTRHLPGQRERTVLDDKDAEFSAYMAARQPSLLRTAYLLTGDRHTAEDLVQTALAKLYLSWDKVQQREHVDGYVRRILVNENNSLWRRPWKKRETTTSELPETPAHDADGPDAGHLLAGQGQGDDDAGRCLPEGGDHRGPVRPAVQGGRRRPGECGLPGRRLW